MACSTKADTEASICSARAGRSAAIARRQHARPLIGRPPIGQDGLIERAVGLCRRQRGFQPLQEVRRMGEMAIHAGQDQGLGPVAEAVEPQHALPGLGRDIGFGSKRRQVDVGRRQARPLLRRAFGRHIAAQPRDQGAQREEIDGVGMVVARQHRIDAGRFRTGQRAELRQGHVAAKIDDGAVGHALKVQRLHRLPCPGQRSVERGEMAPHQVDHAHAHRGADVGKEFGGLSGRRRFGDGRKRIVHSAACLESWPSTVKNDADLGCLGNSTRPSVRRAKRASLPRTMRPSFGLGMGLRAIGTASAAV